MRTECQKYFQDNMGMSVNSKYPDSNDLDTYDFSSPNFHQSGSYHGLPLEKKIDPLD